MSAPLVLFVYNRPWHTEQTIKALQNNLLADETDLYIFSDAPKVTGNLEKDCKTAGLVTEVRNIIKKIKGFRTIAIRTQKENLGLATSIISGVTEVLSYYRKVIVMEDDLVSSPFFLRYMNDALNHYELETRVFNINAFALPPCTVQIPGSYLYDTYFLYRSISWGWGTWQDRWEKAIWNHERIKDLLNDSTVQLEFNRGGEDLTPMLMDQLAGKIDSWAIRWCFTISKFGGLSLSPVHSYINNIGFDGTGVHCGKTDDDSGYRNDLSLAKRDVTFPLMIEADQEIARRFAVCFGEMPLLLCQNEE